MLSCKNVKVIGHVHFNAHFLEAVLLGGTTKPERTLS